MYKQILSLFSIGLFCSSVFAFESMHAAAGAYDSTINKTRYPFIGVLSTQGKSWTFPTIKLPSDFDNFSQLERISCSNNYCAAIGFYKDKTREYPSLLAVGKDDRSSWSSIEIPHSTDKSLSAIHCNHQNCVAVGGSYSDVDKTPLPLIIVGNNKGDQWSYPKINNLPPHLDIYLHRVNCTEKNCIAGGVIKDNQSKELPFIAYSMDQGTSWFSASVPVPADYFNKASIYSISCNAKTCIASGEYHKKDTKYDFPLVLVGQDHGLHWQLVKIPEAPIKADGPHMNVMKCYDSVCLGVGNYGESPYPLLIRSTDNGVTWSYPESIISGVPKVADIGSFKDVSCKGQLCMAAGDYLISNDNRLIILPWVAISHNAGASWIYKFPAPSDLKEGRLEGIICDDNQCIAVGQYQNGQTIMPYVATTYTQGESWEFPIDKSMLPSDFKAGAFFSIDNNEPNSLLKKITQKKQFGTYTLVADLWNPTYHKAL